MKKETFTIEGMSCKNCEARVRETLAETEGITDVSVSLDGGSATVTYDENLITPGEIKEVVEDLGYDLILP